MDTIKVKAEFRDYKLPESVRQDGVVIVPGVQDTFKMKYGQHLYFLYDFRNCQVTEVKITHSRIIRP